MADNKVPFMIVGAGPEGRVALDILNLLDVVVYGFISQDETQLLKEVNDILVAAQLGSKDCDTLLQDEHIRLIIAERDTDKRIELVEALADAKAEIANAIHPFNSISPYARLGRGNLISAGAVIQPNAMIGSFNLLDSYVSVETDAALGDYCTLHAGVRIGREAQIHNEAVIGMGAIIHAGVRIGEGAMVGPGAVVLKDVEDGQTVFGNPAKVM
ncbi:MAG: acetyltransferase [Bacteroidetes bacterium]|nr:MAG: acetyltransferase [Bacteroidota bacterium]